MALYIPLPEKSAILPETDVLVVGKNYLLGQGSNYGGKFCRVTRFLIGENYAGTQLPIGTRQVHDIRFSGNSDVPGQIARMMGISFNTLEGDEFQGFNSLGVPIVANGFNLESLSGKFKTILASEYPRGEEIDLVTLLDIHNKSEVDIIFAEYGHLGVRKFRMSNHPSI